MSSALDSGRDREFRVRSLESLQDFQDAERLQREAWGYDDIDIVPAAIFSVARNFGGQAIGAVHESRDGNRLVGFGLSFGAIDEGYAHFHSHMVAVVPEFQNCGLGRLIKLAQREDALRRGIDQIVWTFDPLQLRNAYFNISRLGGVGVRYIPNLYGMTSSPLHGGIPTDRLVIEWNLTSAHVERALTGMQRERSTAAVSIEIPSASKDVPREIRLDGQMRLREQLMALFDAGFAITGFGAADNTAHYFLEKHDKETGEKR
jgi:predicted GNAT superfamily acetyltransferase